MSIIIGLTGENCAGKGTVADYLVKKGFYYYSLSDAIREELASEGKEISREALIAKGNDLRRNFGSDILAKRTIAKLQPDRNYVVDSIRNPAEARALLDTGKMALVYVTAPAEKRFERMKARRREGDPRSFEAFRTIEKLELDGKDEHGQRLNEVFALAAKKITNEADFRELYDEVDAILGELSSEFKPKRPNWDVYFMNIAKVVASRSNCLKRHVAAVIVKDKRIVSTGYNGTPRGIRNCNEGGCPRCNSFADSGTKLDECVCSHGEENAIVQASYHGISIKDATIYSTFSPCLLCTKMTINSGIREVVYNADYPLSEMPLKLLKEAGIIVRRVKLEKE
ncbi:TPA: AAA family ATPase [Candidatus Micrarchaeota archaeon]|nr:AAA family ATPase [Candidatus Micrarchaeota archaeon]